MYPSRFNAMIPSALDSSLIINENRGKMAKKPSSYHLMAVPKHFTSEVLEAGGRFMKMKNKRYATQTLTLVTEESTMGTVTHILDPSQHRSYEMLGEDYIEDMTLCNTVFEHNRGSDFQIFKGSVDLADCKECKKVLRRINAPERETD